MTFTSSLSGSLRWLAVLLPVFAIFSAASTGCANEMGTGSSEDDFASEDGSGAHGYGYGNHYGYAGHDRR